MEQELEEHYERADDICRTPSDEEAEYDSDPAGLKKLEELRQARQNEFRLMLVKVKEMDQRYRMAMGVDLTLVYSRLQDWEKVDEFTCSLLEVFGPPGELPQLKSERDEERWAQVMVRRGVACAYL